MITYSRWSTWEAADEVEAHVRAHLSSVASEDDNPETSADDVETWRVPAENDWGVEGVRVHGRLDAVANAPYLRGGFDPEQDVAANPLSVRSITEEC